jgi:hypothetical protein
MDSPFSVGIVITSVIMICVFTFITVKVWADERRKERESFYRSEVLKKLADATGTQAQQVLDMMREQDRNEERRNREGGRLAGMILTGSGIGLSVMFGVLEPTSKTWVLGLTPALIGVALLIYNYVLAPRSQKVGMS